MYGHSVGIYNCKAGDFNASDVTVTSSFDYKSFMEPLVHLHAHLHAGYTWLVDSVAAYMLMMHGYPTESDETMVDVHAGSWW